MGCCIKTITVVEIIVMVVVGVCALALIMCGVFIARPGIWGNNFEETNCTVLGNKTIDPARSCSCGSSKNNHCSSVTPCIEVEVEFNARNKNATELVTAMIYSDESLGVNGGECSVWQCERSAESNRKYVYDTFLPKYGKTGESYKCYYNPENYKQVIIDRQFSMTAIVLSLAVPAAALLLSTLALFIVCKFKIGEDLCRPNNRGKGNNTGWNGNNTGWNGKM